MPIPLPLPTIRGFRSLLVAGCLAAAPGCASWYQPPAAKPRGGYTLETMEDEHLERIQRDLSLYSD